MQMVLVELARPWDTPAGLRRPQEGPITVTAEEAEKIVAAGAGAPVEMSDEDPADLSQLDHDGDGRPGGSLPGKRRRAAKPVEPPGEADPPADEGESSADEPEEDGA